MNKETHEALKVLINYFKTGATDLEGVYSKEIEQVEAWIDETAKEYEFESSEVPEITNNVIKQYEGGENQ